MRRSLLALVASVLLLAAFLVLAGPAALLDRLAGTDPAWFGLSLVLVALSLVCWSEGLRPLLAAANGPVSAWRGGVAYTAAMGGRQLVPVGALGGPAITAYALDRESALSFEATLAVVTVAEFIATVASLVVAGAGLFVLVTAGALAVGVWPVVTILLVVAAVLAMLALGFWYRRRAVAQLLGGTTRVVGRGIGQFSGGLGRAIRAIGTGGTLDRFYETVDDLAAHPRTLAISTAFHLLGWVSMALALSASAGALDVGVPIGAVLFAVPASLLVDVLPLPGGLGGVEVALAALLVVLVGLELPVAAAVAVLYRLAAFWFVILLGVLAGLYTSLRLKDVLAAAP